MDRSRPQFVPKNFISLIFSSRRRRFSFAFFICSEFFAMTRLAVLFVLIVVCFASIANTRTAESLVPYAIKSMIDEYFAKNVHEIEVVNFGVRNGRGEETIERLLRLGNEKMPMKVIRDASEHLESDEYQLNNSSIVLFDSPENFNRTQHRIVFQHGQLISHPHLVHIHNAEIEDIQVIAYKSYTIDKTTFLVHETLHSIQLATSFMFTPEACRKNQFKVINRFTRGEKRWENLNFYVEKYRNFYKCPLKIDARTQDHFLAAQLNYRIDSQSQTVHLNQTLSISFAHLTVDELSKYNTYVIDIEPRKIYIPPGELYGDIEKMFLPFDTSTWIAIAVLIATCTLSILIIKLMPQEIQNAIFGSNNRSPFMNFVNIMINGSQSTNLTGNVARIILTTFMFWSLIFRTAYQSKSFEILQQLKRKPMMNTLDRLVEANFTLYTVFPDECRHLSSMTDERGLPR
jgi:hypothetical protein